MSKKPFGDKNNDGLNEEFWEEEEETEEEGEEDDYTAEEI
jgi:hypothetical protein